MVVTERFVSQRTVDTYFADAERPAVEQMSELMAKARLQKSDIQSVFMLGEFREETRRGKRTEKLIVSVYLQGKPGKMDYKYMNGVDFLIPVRNVYAEVVQFLQGGWCK